jgi:hypothetical protein
VRLKHDFVLYIVPPTLRGAAPKMLSVTCTSDSSAAVDMQASVKSAVCIGGEPVHAGDLV